MLCAVPATNKAVRPGRHVRVPGPKVSSAAQCRNAGCKRWRQVRPPFADCMIATWNARKPCCTSACVGVGVPLAVIHRSARLVNETGAHPFQQRSWCAQWLCSQKQVATFAQARVSQRLDGSVSCACQADVAALGCSVCTSAQDSPCMCCRSWRLHLQAPRADRRMLFSGASGRVYAYVQLPAWRLHRHLLRLWRRQRRLRLSLRHRSLCRMPGTSSICSCPGQSASSCACSMCVAALRNTIALACVCGRPLLSRLALVPCSNIHQSAGRLLLAYLCYCIGSRHCHRAFHYCSLVRQIWWRIYAGSSISHQAA
jgi:hypothetical protein